MGVRLGSSRPWTGGLALIAGAVALAGVGCSARWALRTERPDLALEWPYLPASSRLTYVRSLTGLTARRGAGAVLRDIAIGAETEDVNSFLLPVAAATGPDGRIAVADMGRRCVHLHVPSEGRYERLQGSGEDAILSPVGLAFDDLSTLYVSDSTGKVFAFGSDGRPLFVLRNAGKERLLRPTGLAYSPTRKLLYVVDTLAHKVHAFGRTGEVVFSFGGRGEAEGFFNFPTHAFRSSTGDLYVTDSLNFRIQIFDESGKPLGAFGHHGDGFGDLARPRGVAVDHHGIVYVVDGLFDNVQLFTRSGAFLLTLGGRGNDFGEFWLPSGAFANEEGELYVCDTYNRRVQVFAISERVVHGAP